MSRQIAQPSAHYELAPDEALALAVHSHFAELRFAAIKAGGKFLADRFESFPRRISDDAVEASSLLVGRVTPCAPVLAHRRLGGQRTARATRRTCAAVTIKPAGPEMERKTARFARQVFGLEMFNKIGTDSFAQCERFIQRLVLHRILDVTGAEVGELLKFDLMIFRQP